MPLLPSALPPKGEASRYGVNNFLNLIALPRWGRQRGGGFAAKKEANPASLRSAAPSKGRGSRGHSLLPMEGGAPKGRIGQKRYEKERGRSSQAGDIREYPIHRWRGPPSPMGKAKRRRLRRKQRKPTPPRCARQPLPREGARVNTPSFQRKEGEVQDPFPHGEGSETRIPPPRTKAFPSRVMLLS